ncbi:DNA polymerase Y family protein [Stenotrophomonas sp. 24(2023)]|uniref:Y-family DNA polymerase n=1 Tax=Stenotrophomonas sp. 24(2023) TaxID=3068324 RepID=UPI0027E13305|nr:DNA polymerase Y family protein [Stenotrophomonas sp. 24(2023)]WMJ69581.1 DNA polymerase Y family protein [Stenotrophomonas sp. 24(2023)]
MDWACLLLPQLALDSVLRHRPDPQQPVALVQGPAQRRVLRAVSPAARAAGLRPGMLLSAAQVLVQALHQHDYDPQAEQHTRALLASWLYGISSQVSLDFPHALVLEIGASRALFGDWPHIERRLRNGLRELGFRHRLVAAPNPHAARVLANVHDRLGIGEAQLAATLAKVPLERSGLPIEAVTVLARSGLRTLGQAFALPRDSLARRFAPAVLQQLDAIAGHAPAPLRFYQPPDRFDARIEFDDEIDSSQALLFPLRRLLQDLAAFLCSRDGGVQQFQLHFEHDLLPASTLPIGLLSPERDAGLLFEIARSRLEAFALPAGSRALRLDAEHLPPFVPAARDLFDTRPAQAMPWPQLRERLRARLGDDAVQPLAVQADHRPEQASGTQPPTAPPAHWPLRPGWLLQPAQPLRDPRLRVLSGPERIESGWWDQHDARRDYYVVETSHGQRGWAYRLRDDPRAPWMLHGWFG